MPKLIGNDIYQNVANVLPSRSTSGGVSTVSNDAAEEHSETRPAISDCGDAEYSSPERQAARRERLTKRLEYLRQTIQSGTRQENSVNKLEYLLSKRKKRLPRARLADDAERKSQGYAGDSPFLDDTPSPAILVGSIQMIISNTGRLQTLTVIADNSVCQGNGQCEKAPIVAAVCGQRDDFSSDNGERPTC